MLVLACFVESNRTIFVSFFAHHSGCKKKHQAWLQRGSDDELEETAASHNRAGEQGKGLQKISPNLGSKSFITSQLKRLTIGYHNGTSVRWWPLSCCASSCVPERNGPKSISNCSPKDEGIGCQPKCRLSFNRMKNCSTISPRYYRTYSRFDWMVRFEG